MRATLPAALPDRRAARQQWHRLVFTWACRSTASLSPARTNPVHRRCSGPARAWASSLRRQHRLGRAATRERAHRFPEVLARIRLDAVVLHALRHVVGLNRRRGAEDDSAGSASGLARFGASTIASRTRRSAIGNTRAPFPTRATRHSLRIGCGGKVECRICGCSAPISGKRSSPDLVRNVDGEIAHSRAATSKIGVTRRLTKIPAIDRD